MQLFDIIFLVILLAQSPEILSNSDTIFTLIGVIPKLIGGSPKNPHWWRTFLPGIEDFSEPHRTRSDRRAIRALLLNIKYTFPVTR
jgi:hypothetical protein